LPPPLGPRTPMRAAGSTSRSRPVRTARPPKDLVRPRATSMIESGWRAASQAASRVPSPSVAPRVHIGPDGDEAIERAVRDGGGELAPLDDADALVWLDWRR